VHVDCYEINLIGYRTRARVGNVSLVTLMVVKCLLRNNSSGMCPSTRLLVSLLNVGMYAFKPFLYRFLGPFCLSLT
jgi:hypothetical protein